MLTGTTSARWSHSSIVVHGSQGHSVGVMEEPEGAVGYNHVWTIPGEEGTVERSLAEHVERGEYMFRTDNSSSNTGDQKSMWTTAYQFKQHGEPNYCVPADRRPGRVDPDGRKPLVDGYEGKKSVAILQAVYESQRTGQPVRI